MRLKLEIIGLFSLFFLFSIPNLFSYGFHYPYEIWNGTFGNGLYTFQDDLRVNGNLCLGADCRTAWPSTPSLASYINVNNPTTYLGSKFVISRTSNNQINVSSDTSQFQIRQMTGTSDAFMTFHVAGDYAVNFGLDSQTNSLVVGGWSMGSNQYKLWHEGNDGQNTGLDSDLLDGLQGSAYQQRVTGTCTAGSSIRQINSDGTVVCETDDSGGSIGIPLFYEDYNFNVDISGFNEFTSTWLVVQRGSNDDDYKIINMDSNTLHYTLIQAQDFLGNGDVMRPTHTGTITQFANFNLDPSPGVFELFVANPTGLNMFYMKGYKFSTGKIHVLYAYNE